MSVRIPKESDILKACRELLHYRRILHIRNNTGGMRYGDNRMMRFGEPGSADLILCLEGKFIAVEVKGPKGRITELQDGWLARVREAGGKAIIVRSPDELNAALDELLKETP